MVHSAFLNPDSWYGKFSTVALNAMNKVKCSNATFAFRAVYFSFCPLGLMKKKKLWLQLISSPDFYMYVQNTFIQEQYFEFKVCLPCE